MRKSLLLTALVICVLFVCGCQSPASVSNNASQPGTVRVLLSTPSRAVVADWSSIVTAYDVNLHCTDRSVPDLDQHVSYTSGQSGVVFPAVNVGTWTISVTALGVPGTVGFGSLAGQILTPTGSLSVGVSISGTQNSTGSYSFTFQFPATSGTKGADYVSAQLYNMANAAVGAPIVPILTGGTQLQATVAQTVASGNYRLELAFRRGGPTGVIAGIYGEGVTVWDNVTSDQWMNSNGNLSGSKTFAVADFNDSNAVLSNLVASVSGETTPLAPLFDSSVANYSLAGTNVVLTPSEAMPGQRIQYQISGTSGWTDIATGSSTVPVLTGSTISFKVTAPDRSTTKTYQIALSNGLNGSTTIYQLANNTVVISAPTATYYGTPTTVSATYGGTTTSYSWYLDGVLLGTGSPYIFTPSPLIATAGQHLLMAVAQDSSTNVLYSAHQTLTIAVWPTNLLQNPGWTPDTAGWAFSTGGGAAWTAGSAPFGGFNAEVSSFAWGTHSQTVDLLSLGYSAAQLQSANTTFTFSEQIAGDYIMPTYWYLTMELLDAGGTVLHTANLGSQGSPYNLPTGASWSLQTITYTNTSGYAIARVRVTGGGMSSTAWDGAYGAWFCQPILNVTVH